MARSHPYLKPDGDGWPDNAERFFRFARAIAARVEQAPPDVLHLNDWHTGAALAALTVQPPTVVSIHNLAYQGVAPGTVAQADRSAGRALRMVGRRQPAHRRLRVGRRDRRGVAELREGDPHAGVRVRRRTCRWRYRGDALTGILNGIDTEVWDPSTDPHIVSRFDADHLEAKAPNRAALLERLGFAGVRRSTRRRRHPPDRSEGDRPPRAPRVAARADPDAGRGARLRRRPPGRRRFTPRPPRIRNWFAFVEGYDESLSHLMFAGADLFLMPSRFEPCGLTQMQAMRYGTVPIVTGVGGLVDTVPDADVNRRDGRGFVAARPASIDLARRHVPGRPADHRPATARHLAAPRDGCRLVVAPTGGRIPRVVRTVDGAGLSTLGAWLSRRFSSSSSPVERASDCSR